MQNLSSGVSKFEVSAVLNYPPSFLSCIIRCQHVIFFVAPVNLFCTHSHSFLRTHSFISSFSHHPLAACICHYHPLPMSPMAIAPNIISFHSITMITTALSTLPYRSNGWLRLQQSRGKAEQVEQDQDTATGANNTTLLAFTTPPSLILLSLLVTLYLPHFSSLLVTLLLRSLPLPSRYPFYLTSLVSSFPSSVLSFFHHNIIPPSLSTPFQTTLSSFLPSLTLKFFSFSPRLYSSAFYDQHMVPFQPPEIATTPLEDLLLQVQ